jgi:hypothetical protein
LIKKKADKLPSIRALLLRLDNRPNLSALISLSPALRDR